MSQDYTTDASEIDLSQWDDSFAKAKIEEHNFEDVPPGKYQVRVERAEIVKAVSTGNPMLKWTLKILGPTHVGRLLWRNSTWVSKDKNTEERLMSWLRTDLHICGVDISTLSELRDRLGDLLDVTLEVTVRSKGENQSISIDRRIVVDSIPDEDDALAPF
ncbi:MAG: DUF669 domain-containing protein [Armatimonadota bacterium]